jgi:predicted ATPase/DNA-binding CsgD family transcriptional regulator
VPRSTPGLNLSPQVLAWEAQPKLLFGREHDLALARRMLLRDEVRLLTLVGPPGVGKTRLALAAAESLRDVFLDSICLMDLATSDPAESISAAISEVLGGVERLSEMPVLLILDNVEHQRSAGHEIGQLLRSHARLKILAAGRMPLNLQWEHLMRLGPLAVPDDTSDASAGADSPAVQLFLHCAWAEDANFRLTPENASSIAEVCTRLDGLPLAIELAAARVRIVSPLALLSHLDHRLDVLVDGPRDLPVRQRSLRRAFDESIDALSAEDQQLFARLALFENGWSVEAASALASDIESHSIPRAHGALDQLESLESRGLIYRIPQTDGQVRFNMLETLRCCAHERLVTSGDLPTVRERCIAYYHALVARTCMALGGADQDEALAVLDMEYPSIQSVLRADIQAADAAALHLVSALSRYWMMRDCIAEGRMWLCKALDMPSASDSDNAPARAAALSAAGDLAFAEGDCVQAEVYQRQSLSDHRQLGDRAGILGALIGLGRVIHRQGDLDRANHRLEEALGLARDLGHVRYLAVVQHALGEILADRGQHALAEARFEQSLDQCHALGDRLNAAGVMESMAILAQKQGDAARALRLAGAARSICERAGIARAAWQHTPGDTAWFHEHVESAREAVGPDQATRLERHGSAMRFETAVAYAHAAGDWRAASGESELKPTSAGTSRSFPQPALFESLTPREREVATLVLRGMSNRQIGVDLNISERTAETHVCRILNKLNLGSRAQIAMLMLDRESQPSIISDAEAVSAAAQ